MLSASSDSRVFAALVGMMALLAQGCKGACSKAPAGGSDVPLSSPAVTEGSRASLKGVVRDRLGIPLPDVLVIAWPKGKRGKVVAQARSGEDGRFTLPGLQPGRWKLLVEAGGLGILETERQVPEDGEAELALDGESRALTGIVTSGQGRPEPGAQVNLGGPGLRWTRTVRSDKNGNFSVPGLGNGRYTLRAVQGQKASPPTVVVTDEGLLRPVHVRLALQPGVMVDGLVVDDTGKPMVDASVDVMAMPSDDLPVSGRTNRDGRFRLGPVAPGRYQVLARLDGYVLFDAPEPTLGARSRETFELRLARTARVTGRVLDEAGNPMPSVLVSSICLIGGRDDLVVIPGALPAAAEAAELPVGRLLRPGGVRTSPTDEEGRFSLSGLAPGRTRIEVLHPDKLPFRREPLLLAPGDVRELGDLTMLAGTTLAGKVVDAEGKIVENALVEARLVARGRHPAVRATTDASGEFVLRVPRGEYTLTAQTEKLVSPARSVRAQGEIQPEPCELHLAPRTVLRR